MISEKKQNKKDIYNKIILRTASEDRNTRNYNNRSGKIVPS